MSIKAQFFDVDIILSIVNLSLFEGSKKVKHALAPISILDFAL